MTISEENYLKVIYHLSLVSPKGVNTNAIAGMLDTKASSVTDMLKKLSEKDLVAYQKYQGVTLTENGFRSARDTQKRLPPHASSGSRCLQLLAYTISR